MNCCTLCVSLLLINDRIILRKNYKMVKEIVSASQRKSSAGGVSRGFSRNHLKQQDTEKVLENGASQINVGGGNYGLPSPLPWFSNRQERVKLLFWLLLKPSCIYELKLLARFCTSA